MQRVELGEEARRRHALGRRVEQHEAAARASRARRGRPRRRRAWNSERGVHAGFLERADLVVHQRDQRADDDGHAVRCGGARSPGPGSTGSCRRRWASARARRRRRSGAGRSPAARRGTRRTRTPRAGMAPGSAACSAVAVVGILPAMVSEREPPGQGVRPGRWRSRVRRTDANALSRGRRVQSSGACRCCPTSRHSSSGCRSAPTAPARTAGSCARMRRWCG